MKTKRYAFMKMIDQFSIQKRMNHLQQAIHPKKDFINDLCISIQ